MTYAPHQELTLGSITSAPYSCGAVTIKEVHEYSHCTVLLLTQPNPSGNGETSWAIRASEITKEIEV